MTKDSIEFRTRLALQDAERRVREQDRTQKRVEAAIAFGPKRPLTAEDKFRMIKSFGSRDGYNR